MKAEIIEVPVPKAGMIMGMAEEIYGYSCQSCGVIFVNKGACAKHEEKCQG